MSLFRVRKLFAAQASCWLLLYFAASAVSAQIADSRSTFEGFDAFAQQVLKDWKGAGFAVAVIEGGKVTYAQGFGVRDLKNNQPVTTKTLFAIGSATKSFTVTSLGVLVDQGKLDWDKPLRTYLPDFQLMDQFASEHMTPRDLVTHRSGLPRHDRMWLNSPFTRQEIFDRLRYLEPNKDFRSTFQYQNLMFMTAGMLAAHVSGMPWEDHVRKVIFDPLGMSSTNFSVVDMQKSADHSQPYTVVKEQIREMDFRNIDTIGPAGSINSNVEDMAKYVMLHMQHGKGVLSLKNSRDMQSPQMSIAGPGPEKELGAQSYGMGFFLTTYRGHYLVHHGGNIDGFTSLVTFMPQDNIGMIILSNQNASRIPTVVSYDIYDRLLGLDQIEWTKRFKTQQERGREGSEEAKKKGYTAQIQGTHPSHPLADYAGDYESPAYGIASVTLENGGLKFNYHGGGGPLNHYHYEVFEVAERELESLSKEKVSFHTNLRGDVDSLSVPFDANVKDIVFSRLADRKMRETTFLQPLTGEYQRGRGVVTVAMKDDRSITLAMQGQPALELEPVRGTRFNIVGQNGSVEFKGDDLVFYQANSVSVATRKK
jgi:CubicO group peptidase (beta-lactamase class C family)